MSDIIVGDKQDLVAVADSIRGLVGGGQMYVSEMATNIDGAKAAVDAALAALTEKGVEVPAGTKVDGLAALIAAIEAGGGSGGANIAEFFGTSIWESGTVTVAAESSSLIIPHGLGIVPKFIVIVRMDNGLFLHPYEYRFSLGYITGESNKYNRSTARNTGSISESSGIYVNTYHTFVLSGYNEGFTTAINENEVKAFNPDGDTGYFKVMPGATYWWLFGA